MKCLKDYILNESYDNDDPIVDYLEDIVHSVSDKPAIYDDSGDWNIRDYFEEYEDDFGFQEDCVKYIKEYADDRAVAGWYTNDSFEATEKIIPKKMIDLMKTGKLVDTYKQKGGMFKCWESKDDQYWVNILQFINKKGYTPEYWYLIAVEQ